MKAELKQAWVAALRSGKYEQGRHQLRTGNRYCCLGVLCDVLGLEWSAGDDEEWGMEMPCGSVEWAVLPAHLRLEHGLSDSAMSALVDLNDGTYCGESTPPQPFSVIADYIENNLDDKGGE